MNKEIIKEKETKSSINNNKIIWILIPSEPKTERTLNKEKDKYNWI